MRAEEAGLAGRSLLAIFAHPDDESLACGGLLARCARAGVRVSLVCATRGEGAGSGDPNVLGEVRAREFDAAARVLGIADLVLLDYEDGMLPWLEAGRLEIDIARAIRRVQPDVIVTFGEDGLYWHPDHIAVHQRTRSAVEALGARAPALYYVTMPPGQMRAVLEAAALRTPGTAHESIFGIGDVDAFGALAAPPTLVVEAGALAAVKLDAIKCHRSQVAGGAFDVLTAADAVRLLGTEHFRRAPGGPSGGTFIDRFAADLASAAQPSGGRP